MKDWGGLYLTGHLSDNFLFKEKRMSSKIKRKT